MDDKYKSEIAEAAKVFSLLLLRMRSGLFLLDRDIIVCYQMFACKRLSQSQDISSVP
jgi:hypothetical protein